MKKGDRVALHPATDDWMRGDRYGEIVGLGKARQYRDRETGKNNTVRPFRVKLDKSGKVKRFHPEALTLVNPRKATRRTQRVSPAQLAARAKFAARAKAGKFRRRRKIGGGTRKGNPGRKAPLSGFQVAALRQGKILFLSGVAMTSNREAASNYGSVTTARHVAKQVRDVGRQLGITKVAVVTRHDAPSEIKRFLLGGA